MKRGQIKMKRGQSKFTRCPTGNGKSFAFGYGIANDPVTARKAAEKMAKDILGSQNVHHPSCKCRGPTGEKIPNCGRKFR